MNYNENLVILSDETALTFCKLLKSLSSHVSSDIPSFKIEDDIISTNSLKKLNMSNHRLTSDNIQNLSCFEEIVQLNLSFNKIEDLSAISLLKKLTLLDISHNKILSLEHLRDFYGIQTLRCNCNFISSLEPLSRCSSLSRLWISNNNINWVDFIFLTNLINLKCLCKSGNPCEDKSKLNDFVLSLLPSLENLDGVVVVKNGIVSDFLKTTDGRIMITQAKAQLPTTHRSQVNAPGLGIGPLRSNSTTFTGNVIVSSVASSSAASSSPRESKPSDYPIPIRPLGTRLRKGSNVHNNSFRSTTSTSTPILATDENDDIDQTNALEVGESGMTTQKHQIQPRQQQRTQHPINAKKFINNKSTPTYSQQEVDNDIDSNEGPQGSTTTNMTVTSIAPSTVLKFGSASTVDDSSGNNNSNAPVALCLYPNGDGYVRWSKTGPIACSLEKGRLFASHKSGSIAVVHDVVQGNGSVMDTRGRCLLVMSEQGTAKVLDKQGLIVNTYRLPSSHTGQSVEDEHSVVVPVTPAMGGIVSLKLELPSSSLSSSPSKGKSQSHQWSFDGLQVEFFPSNGELRLKVQNERAISTFSSICEGKLVKDRLPEFKVTR